MSINSVQFQTGLSMAELIARYGTEANATVPCTSGVGRKVAAAWPALDGPARGLGAGRRSTTSAAPAGTRPR